MIDSRIQPPNINGRLTKAQFITETETRVVSKYRDPRCGTCLYNRTGPSVTFKIRKSFFVNSNKRLQYKEPYICNDLYDLRRKLYWTDGDEIGRWCAC